MAYANEEPFGFPMDNWRMGVQAATTANVVRGKGQKALKPSDFSPRTTRGPQMTERQRRELAERRARKGKS
jgi:hypothetical protein